MPYAAPLTQESAMENVSLKENVEHLPVQIFPDPLESADECYRRIKGRLPSITVELTDAGEVESGELRWPPPEEPSPRADAEDVFEASAEPDAPGEIQPGPSEAAPAGEDLCHFQLRRLHLSLFAVFYQSGVGWAPTQTFMGHHSMVTSPESPNWECSVSIRIGWHGGSEVSTAPSRSPWKASYLDASRMTMENTRNCRET
ncbi:uncharacterized protein LOC122542694 [Chiloscyllium plagiosum]|uniref:uncharacterized protein LOC122542694 n=1 Tax=Chiloscyllium plagiosum TaxID=36176 RepID=UPI001CB7D970|nr:uncharacterized protein LOC122542694 [Chiloscyllium plagiosum]